MRALFESRKAIQFRCGQTGPDTPPECESARTAEERMGDERPRPSGVSNRLPSPFHKLSQS